MVMSLGSVWQVSQFWFGSVNQTISVRSFRFVLMKNRVRVRCVRFGFGSIPVSTGDKLLRNVNIDDLE